MNRLAGVLVDLLFPRCCVACGAEGAFLCAGCRTGLEPLDPPWCPRCGRPAADGRPCDACRGRGSSLAGIRSGFAYRGPIRQAVIQFKYRGVRAMSAELAALLHQRLQAHPVPFTAIVPVPLFRDRLRERGYNQAALLARDLARLTGVPSLPNAITRTRSTPPQVRQPSRSRRLENLAGAFRGDQPMAAGQELLLVDDVCTTGATLESCARALRDAGARSVWGLTLAREL